MTSPIKTVANKLAFTLLELVIVVLIMGIIYSLVSINLEKSITSVNKLDSSNLRDFMRKQHDGVARAFYLYGDACQYYSFVPELSQEFTVDSLSFSPQIRSWVFDDFGNLRALEFAPLKIENESLKVCLKYELFSNESSSDFIIEDGKRFFYAPYFEKVQSFETLEEAKTKRLAQDLNPSYLGLRP